MAPMPYVALQSMLDAGSPKGMRNRWSGGIVRDLGPTLVDRMRRSAVRLPGPLTQILISPLPDAVRKLPDELHPHRAAPWTLNPSCSTPVLLAGRRHHISKGSPMGSDSDSMDRTTASLLYDLLRFVAEGPRSYGEVMEAWRTSCPRLPIWEEATERGLLRKERDESGVPVVRITAAGSALLLEAGGS